MSEHAPSPSFIQQANGDASDSVVVDKLLEHCLDRRVRWEWHLRKRCAANRRRAKTIVARRGATAVRLRYCMVFLLPNRGNYRDVYPSAKERRGGHNDVCGLCSRQLPQDSPV